MNENITRIADLPDILRQPQLSNNVEMGLPNSYIPINDHPNPYGNSNQPSLPPPIHFNDLKDSSRSISHDQRAMLDNTPFQRLPSRDIPMDTSHYSHDEQIQSNYIPPSNNLRDYVREHEEITEKKLKKHKQEKHRTRFVDTLFTEIQIPLFIAVLFLIFQMPFYNYFFIKFLPFLQLYNEDGQIKFQGIVLKSCLFGLSYYFIWKSCEYIGEL
jgi:hypothetical protein